MMTKEESLLSRKAYGAIERKRTLHFNQGQPEDKETDDKDMDIMVRTTATGTQDTTVCQENTQLDKTNRTSSETTAIPNVRHSPIIPLGRRMSLFSSVTTTLYAVSVKRTLSVT
jgi:hypothetical protein